MTKKELVQTILSEICKSQIPTYRDVPYLADKGYWDAYPNGDVLDSSTSLESQLARFDIPVLEGIASINDYKAENTADLIIAWERAGLLQTQPSLIEFEKVPVLKFRHDAYLAFGGDCFRLCEDAAGHGWVVESEKDCIELLRVIDLFDSKYDSLKKILFASYAMEAIADLREPIPPIFEEWLDRTFSNIIIAMADNTAHLELKTSYVYRPLRQAYLANNHTVTAAVFFGSNAVSIGCDYKRFGWKNATVVFPDWNPDWAQWNSLFQTEDSYRTFMWWRLFVFISRYINFYFNLNSMGPIEAGNFDASAVGFFPYQERCLNIEHLKDVILGRVR